MTEANLQTTKAKLITLLSGYLGLEPEDIKIEDSLESDLHMHATEMSDFMSTLEENSFDTSKIDLAEIDTVEDLFESLV